MTRDELLRKWVDALESGKYEQGTGRLRSGDAYCCLGVYCDISGQGKWKWPDRIFELEGQSYFMYLPSFWRETIGLSWDDQNELVAANDKGESFPQIAQRIRALFPDVFAVSV